MSKPDPILNDGVSAKPRQFTLPADAVQMIQFPLRRNPGACRCGQCDTLIPAGALIVLLAETLPICSSTCAAIAIYGSDRPGRGLGPDLRDPDSMRSRADDLDDEADGLESEANGYRAQADELRDKADDLEKRAQAADRKLYGRRKLLIGSEENKNGRPLYGE